MYTKVKPTDFSDDISAQVFDGGPLDIPQLSQMIKKTNYRLLLHLFIRNDAPNGVTNRKFI